ncbi:MAG: hypothetical protein V1925_02570, partial [Candidatus Omnitrophota bacterium]
MPALNVKLGRRILKGVSLMTLFFCLFCWHSVCLAANSAPSVGTVTPSAATTATGTPQLFTATYNDPDGWQNIQYVFLLVNSSVSGINCPYLYYNQNTNKLYLRNDANSTWLGGFAPGSSNTIQNSYAKLNCASTIVSGSGTTLTVKWSVTAKAPFTGTKNIYLYIKDDAGATTGYKKAGTWAIPNKPPSTGTITPSSAVGQAAVPQLFTATYNDLNGWLNIQHVFLLVNTSASGKNCPYLYYNQNTNKLYLRNDANSTWLGGFAPGTSNTIENSYVKLNCALTTVSGSGTTLTVNWSVSAKPAFTGIKNTYLYVRDDAGAYTGFKKAGTWNIDITPPVIVITSPQDGAVIEESPVQLEGTVDGTAFSESRALNPGENTLTKTATDAAGNTSSASVEVYLYLGKLIGPAGGVVTSPDGKVKVTIPSGALTTPTQIRILRVTNASLPAPAGKALLSAVDCKPYGLVFAKTVKITYTLDQAEIPGTRV